MSEHNLDLPISLRDKRRNAWKAAKALTLPIDKIYLPIGRSNIGRNATKRKVKNENHNHN